jgi:hypothetical protein
MFPILQICLLMDENAKKKDNMILLDLMSPDSYIVLEFLKVNSTTWHCH